MEGNQQLVNTLKVTGLACIVGSVLVVIINIVTDFPWDLIAGLFLLSYLLLGGLSLGIAGLISEKPEISRKFFAEWLIVTAAILIWVLFVYAFL